MLRPRRNDKFLLGGSTSLRGFQFAGIGPRENGIANLSGYALGGDAYYAVGFHVLTPLPYLPVQHLRGMCFLNGGSLVPLGRNSIKKNIADLIGNPSISAGIGLVARFAGFRLELNYCLPLRITSTDSLNSGFQFGIGINLM
jgi:outer membrane protein insertion porin family